MVQPGENICPRCLSPRVKAWRDLTDEQKMLAERLPMSADHTEQERKKHYFCTHCWFEATDTNRLV